VAPKNNAKQCKSVVNYHVFATCYYVQLQYYSVCKKEHSAHQHASATHSTPLNTAIRNDFRKVTTVGIKTTMGEWKSQRVPSQWAWCVLS